MIHRTQLLNAEVPCAHGVFFFATACFINPGFKEPSDVCHRMAHARGPGLECYGRTGLLEKGGETMPTIFVTIKSLLKFGSRYTPISA